MATESLVGLGILAVVLFLVALYATSIAPRMTPNIAARIHIDAL